MIGRRIPQVEFKLRVPNNETPGNSKFLWKQQTSTEIFSGKRSLLFSLPGAFTPTCSTYQLPDFERLYPKFIKLGFDQVLCISVNDAFVMNTWGEATNLKHVTLLPDGSGTFTRMMGMLVLKDNLGFGSRSWRYAADITDMVISKWFEEAGRSDNCRDDPYEVTSPNNILNALKA